jgi:hypothetical protein
LNQQIGSILNLISLFCLLVSNTDCNLFLSLELVKEPFENDESDDRDSDIL